jgi:hypothetical protein
MDTKIAGGRKIWYIPDGYLPSSGLGEKYEGHEAICILNVTGQDATVKISFYFSDQEPVEGIVVKVGAKRSKHIRLDKPEEIGGYILPRDVPYGMKIESDVNIIVQYSRLDVTQPNFTLMTTIPFYE